MVKCFLLNTYFSNIGKWLLALENQGFFNDRMFTVVNARGDYMIIRRDMDKPGGVSEMSLTIHDIYYLVFNSSA